MLVTRSSRCGLRGCRVGEALPGPRVRRRRRVLSSVSRSDSNFTILLDGIEDNLSVGATVDLLKPFFRCSRVGPSKLRPQHELVRDNVLLGCSSTSSSRDSDSDPGTNAEG